MTTDYLKVKRLNYWEKDFPGSTEDIEKIFGEQMPSIKQVAKWKNKWYQTTPYQFALSGFYGWEYSPNDKIKAEIEVTTCRVGIHQYFWDLWVDRIERETVDHGTSITKTMEMRPTVSFYKEEHLVMFKLAWR